MDLLFLWIIQLSPLLGFIVIQLLPKPFKKAAPVIGIAGSLAAAAASLWLFGIHADGGNLPQEHRRAWLEVAQGSSLVVGFLLDRLNLLMVTLVTTISFFVQVFSAYYMAEDRSRHRYFGFLSFFAFSMTGLVLSNNLLQTFLFWELVGLSSYLLIGFWYEKPSAAQAARKAFVVNRLGDLGFYLGVILLFLLFGSLNFTDLHREALRQALPPSLLTVIGILIFTGAMGKSALFPLHVWLPDAMEGPTPVSALIHSATMVAAGVFLLARAFDLFGASAVTLLVVLTAGALTALIGASLAVIQRDVKRILAYSTISQLGLMVMGIGAGSSTAGMFHLSTHACFKSLLFLSAGAYIHAFHTNDLWEIAKSGGKKDRLTLWALGLGLFSLSGIFPFSGFFSKDMILEIIKEKNPFFYGTALVVSFLTVYYSFRMLFVLIFSKTNRLSSVTHHEPPIGDHASDHTVGAALGRPLGAAFLAGSPGFPPASHRSPALEYCKAIPLVSLALLSLYAGALGTPIMGHK
ncbi:MAG: NADH-quinone oxidoreductase subunit L, partial [Candidatus Omnitrophica bacterium]|nr:NADH-quinone oxidoreductase subunit L [Candidatus Omnitrophota bacterium]